MGKKFGPEDIARMLAEARAKLPTAGVVTTEEPELELTAVARVPFCFGPDFGTQAVHSAEDIQNQVATLLGNVRGVARDDITYNEKQAEFIRRGSAGESLVLIGAAGTGKTTCQRGLGKKLISDGRIRPLSRSTKWLRAGLPGIAVVSFTNKAVNNIRHALPDDLKHHALTIHKLLEFAPEYYEVEDPEHPGEFKKTMRFVPQRNRYNPLPSELQLIIIEESSMVDVPLHDQLLEACPHNPQIIYLGDIQQLPPVFGSSILGFKMLELPVIELTEIYRQAQNSPIIDLAWKILSGNSKIFDSRAKSVEKEIRGKKVMRKEIPALQALSRENEDGTVVFQPWQKKLSADLGLVTLTKQFCEWSDHGYYNPNEDIILCPFNVSFGTIEINKGIAQHLGRKRKAVVHEVIAGYNKHYLAVGDRVLFQKEDAFISRIVRNGDYLGQSFQKESEFLDRWGHLRTEDMDASSLDGHKKAEEADAGFDLEAIDKYLEAAASDSEDRVTSASHVVTVQYAGEKYDSPEDGVILDSAKDINDLLGGYCITIHKSQGSEWNKVFIALHHSHSTMNQRELLYTAVTRARKHLHIICEPETLEKGVVSQKIKGNTLAEKAEFFKGKVAEREKELAVKKALENSDPVKQAFEKVGEWDQLMRDAVLHWWKIAQQFWPEKLKELPAPGMTWKVRGSAAGLANYAMHEVSFNPVYLHVDPTDMIADTCPHEVAHIVAKKVFNSRGHDGGWKTVMQKFGRNPQASRFHNLGSLPEALRKFVEQSQAEAGENPNEED